MSLGPVTVALPIVAPATLVLTVTAPLQAAKEGPTVAGLIEMDPRVGFVGCGMVEVGVGRGVDIGVGGRGTAGEGMVTSDTTPTVAMTAGTATLASRVGVSTGPCYPSLVLTARRMPSATPVS